MFGGEEAAHVRADLARMICAVAGPIPGTASSFSAGARALTPPADAVEEAVNKRGVAGRGGGLGEREDGGGRRAGR
ncbi:hypothetical protein ACFZBU_40275 [Embleya sp. NPDC008237]|uniref:hypothetical protein n=1 Tax=Embleya sp. NPDC008237 TaxID=3363978 RepID=UPI0036E85012